MSLRSRIFLIVGAVVLVLGVVGGLLYLRTRSAKTPGSTDPTPTASSTVSEPLTGQTPTTIPAGLPVRQMTTEEAEQNGVKQLGRVFVERYGTYSTDNNGQNVLEVKGLVTPELWQKIAPKPAGASTDFVGLTTQVATMEITSYSANEAKLSFRTVRTQLKGGLTSSAQQTIALTMVKSGGNWLVSDFAWQK